MVGPRIKKKDTRMREAIGPAERLTLTLQYLGVEMISSHSVSHIELVSQLSVTSSMKH